VELKRLKTIHDCVMRWSFCAIWMAALIIGFEEFLQAITYDVGSAEQNVYVGRAGLCMLVFLIAIIAHAYQVPKHE